MSSTQTPKAPGPASRKAPPREKHTRRSLLMGGAAVLGLAATGTSAWALDRFVIDHTEISDVAAYEAAHSSVTPAQAAAATDVTVTDTAYTSSNTSITIARASTGSGSDALTYYAADVVASDARAVRSAFANNEYGTNITARPSEIAAEHDAVLAVNGDYYGFRSDGILIRNGVIYRDDGVREGIALYADGRAEVYDETATTARGRPRAARSGRAGPPWPSSSPPTSPTSGSWAWWRICGATWRAAGCSSSTTAPTPPAPRCSPRPASAGRRWSPTRPTRARARRCAPGWSGRAGSGRGRT